MKRKNIKKKFLTFLISGIFVLSGIGLASAAPLMSLVDIEHFSPNILLTAGQTHTYSHTYSFNPPAASIDNATFSVTIYDDVYDGVLEYAKIWTEGMTVGTWYDLGQVDDDTYYKPITVAGLLDGQFDVILKCYEGSFNFDTSTLAMEYVKNTNNGNGVLIPEPASMLLLGSGLLGLVGFKKKKPDQS